MFLRPYIRSSVKKWVPAFRNRPAGPRLVVWPVAAWLGVLRGEEESAARDDSTHLSINRWALPPLHTHTHISRARCSFRSIRSARRHNIDGPSRPFTLNQPSLPLVKRPGGIQPCGRRLSPYYTYGGSGLFCFFLFYFLRTRFLFNIFFFRFFPIFFPPYTSSRHKLNVS